MTNNVFALHVPRLGDWVVCVVEDDKSPCKDYSVPKTDGTMKLTGRQQSEPSNEAMIPFEHAEWIVRLTRRVREVYRLVVSIPNPRNCS
jgi:hypothetical protein